MNVVWPRIEKSCQYGELVPVELGGGQRDMLDTLAGIDAWQVDYGQQRMRGIASRVQWRKPQIRKPFPYNTFTIRKARASGVATEIDKRLMALARPVEEQWLLPALTIQAYLDGNDFISCGIVYTRDLYGYIVKRGVESFEERQNGDASWFAVPWHELLRDKIKLTMVVSP